MRFEWDEAKRQSNIQKHGIDFVGIEKALAGITLTILDDRFDYGESRFITLGLAQWSRRGYRAYRDPGGYPNHFSSKGDQK